MGLEEQNQGRLLTVRAFADAAGTSQRRVRRLVRQGRVETVSTPAGEVRIPESELDRFEQERSERLKQQSVELQSVSMGGGALVEVGDSFEGAGGGVPLPRHEAAMVRLGFLESELSALRQRLEASSMTEQELETRAEEAEQDAISATVRAVEAEHQVEVLREEVALEVAKTKEIFEKLQLEEGEKGQLKSQLEEIEDRANLYQDDLEQLKVLKQELYLNNQALEQKAKELDEQMKKLQDELEEKKRDHDKIVRELEQKALELDGLQLKMQELKQEADKSWWQKLFG